MNEKLKAVVYVRGNGTNKNYLIEQKNKCFAFAKANGIEIVGITEDFEALLKSGADAVIIASGCRLSRDLYEYAMKIKRLEKVGLKLYIAGNK